MKLRSGEDPDPKGGGQHDFFIKGHQLETEIGTSRGEKKQGIREKPKQPHKENQGEVAARHPDKS